MRNNGTRGNETTLRIPLLHVQHVPFCALIDVLYVAFYWPCFLYKKGHVPCCIARLHVNRAV